MTDKQPSSSGVVSLGDLLRINPKPPACLIEPGLLPQQGILFCGGEPKVGKSLLVANLALALAAGSCRAGFNVPAARKVLMCQFELPTEQFAARLWLMRQSLGLGADDNLFVDTRSAGNLLSSSSGLNHFIAASRAAAADVIVLDPLYSAHDQDENDTRAMASLCQTLLRLRDASRAALIVVHHIRKSIGRHEIGSAFRGSSALHAVGDSYMLLTRPSPQLNTIELRFQFRYAAPHPPMLLRLDATSLWFASSDQLPQSPESRRKVETSDVQKALASIGSTAGYNELLYRIMTLTICSKRTAQLAITRACDEKGVLKDNGHYLLPS